MPASASIRHTASLAAAGTALAIAVALASWWGHGEGLQGLVMAARYTARLAFALFLVVFLARPLAGLIAAPWLLRERRGLGLAFAGAHFTHLAALTATLVALGEPPALLTAVFGGFGYLVLLAMVVTSTDAARRAMGRGWSALHRFGVYYLWFIFAVTYLRRVMGRPDMAEYWVLLGIALAALAWRLIGAVQYARWTQKSASATSARL